MKSILKSLLLLLLATCVLQSERVYAQSPYDFSLEPQFEHIPYTGPPPTPLEVADKVLMLATCFTPIGWARTLGTLIFADACAHYFAEDDQTLSPTQPIPSNGPPTSPMGAVIVNLPRPPGGFEPGTKITVNFTPPLPNPSGGEPIKSATFTVQ